MSINSRTHDLGPFFWHSIKLKKASPLAHFFPSYELEEPYRYSKSLILRVPFIEFGIVLGFWRKDHRTEEEAILLGMSGRQMSDEEFTEAEKVNIRRNLIRGQYPAEDQKLLVEALDI